MPSCARYAPLLVALLVASQSQATTRSFVLTYRGQIIGLKPREAARIWIPIPPNDRWQTVKEISRKLPAPAQLGREERFGNRMLCFQSLADQNGAITFQIAYRITRQEVRSDLAQPPHKPIAGEEDDLFLQPDSHVPVGGKPMSLLKGLSLPADQLRLARLLYGTVDKHMTYAKDTPGWGHGDATWACESRRGNCSDFHSLFISLARSCHIPARFEIGFPLPQERGHGTISGYHCWAWFKPSGYDWVPVDISEANKHPPLANYYFGNLTENRVAFSTGRDLLLSPRQSGPPLNFFVDPYVEVHDKPWPADRIRCWCEYRDTE